MKNVLFYFVLFSVISACSTVKYHLNPDVADVRTLSLCVTYSHTIPDTIKKTFDGSIRDYMYQHNSENHLFRLQSTDDSSKSALKIKVLDTKLPSTGRQVACTMMSIVGIGMPIIFLTGVSPVPIFFYAIPKDVSTINLRLSDDLCSKNYTHKRSVKNSAYFRGQRKQIEKHGFAFSKYLEKEVNRFEKQFRQTRLDYSKGK